MSNKETTIEDLAVMIKQGFDNTASKNDLNELRNEMTGRFGSVEESLDKIEMKLDNVAYRFEVQALEQRVKRLEQLVGVKANA